MGLVVTVDGSCEIPDSFLVHGIITKCDVFGIKEMLYYKITSKKKKKVAYFCEKLTLSENCNTYSPGLPYIVNLAQETTLR